MIRPFKNSNRRHLAIVMSDNIANWMTFHGKDAGWLQEQTGKQGFPRPLDLAVIHDVLAGLPVGSETLARIGNALPLPMNCHLAMNPKRFLEKLEEDRLAKLSRTFLIPALMGETK